MWTEPLYNTTKVTLELRELVENGVNIWDFEYPSFYQGEQKTAFEKKVIDHYYFRQIGQETVGRFKHYFRTKVQEIMPYYVQLYKSVEIMENLDDPFGNVDITETFEETTTGTNSGTATTTANDTERGTSSGTETQTGTDNKTHKFSTTPQGDISNLEHYMTEGSVDTNSEENSLDRSNESELTTTKSGSSSSSSENFGTVTHTLTKKGNQGVNTYAHDMKELRETFLNVDMMIIEDLNELFLAVY